MLLLLGRRRICHRSAAAVSVAPTADVPLNEARQAFCDDIVRRYELLSGRRAYDCRCGPVLARSHRLLGADRYIARDETAYVVRRGYALKNSQPYLHNEMWIEKETHRPLDVQWNEMHADKRNVVLVKDVCRTDRGLDLLRLHLTCEVPAAWPLHWSAESFALCTEEYESWQTTLLDASRWLSAAATAASGRRASADGVSRRRTDLPLLKRRHLGTVAKLTSWLEQSNAYKACRIQLTAFCGDVLEAARFEASPEVLQMCKDAIIMSFTLAPATSAEAWNMLVQAGLAVRGLPMVKSMQDMPVPSNETPAADHLLWPSFQEASVSSGFKTPEYT